MRYYIPFGFGPYLFGPGWLSKHVRMNTTNGNPSSNPLLISAEIKDGEQENIKDSITSTKNCDAKRNHSTTNNQANELFLPVS
ncbi:hypothetical protein FACS189419_00030 [Planctomycetales bacterium]|nr:hypothetical protein FACS189419_00030 [Planctomycetales bacterium]